MIRNFSHRFAASVAAVLLFATASQLAGAQAPPQNFIVHAAPKPVAAIDFQDDQGHAKTLADFKGKAVVLNIWATWCTSCRTEMPALDRLEADLGAANFAVVVLSIDRGGISSIGVSHTVINSLFTFNDAIGFGANPAKSGTPGGGSGAGIYNDGNTFTLSLCGVEMTDNTAREGGGAIFFVSNDRSGSLVIDRSVLRRNTSQGFQTQGFPGIFVLANGPPRVTDSIIE